MKIFRNSYVALIIAMSLILAGCNSSSNVAQKNDGGSVENEDSKSSEDVHFRQQLEDNEILYVKYQTTEEEFEAGTAFSIQTDYSKEPILVTAHHLFGPLGGLEIQLNGNEVSKFVTGGEIFDMFSEKTSGTTIKENITISDAEPLPDINKDVAAFKLNNTGNLKPFKVSDKPCKKGDKLYLLASLWNNDTVNENNIYSGKCKSDADGILYYELDKNFSTNGASGAPIVNEKGEVVGIHIGSDGNGLYVGNSATSFNDMIKKSFK